MLVEVTWPTGNSSHTTSIHILDDNSLLKVFHLYRPFLLGEDQDVNIRLEGGEQWAGERWWYRLAHVCQRWRNIILGSPSYLGLCLVCTYGTPVADMLLHSPPLPLIIDYEYDNIITAEDEKAIMLALEQRDRVRRIRFDLPVLKLQKFIMAFDGEYPTLEHLILLGPYEEKREVLILPETFQTPHLRHLVIDCSIQIPIRSPLLGTAAGLVVLCLVMYHPSTYFQPTVLLQWLSSMPQLEILISPLTSLFSTAMWRGNSCASPSRHTPPFLTFVHLATKLLALIQKQFLVGSPPLSSKIYKFPTSTNSRFPFHSFCNS